MATSTTSRRPLHSSRRRRQRGRGAIRAIVVLGVGVLVLAAGTLIGLRLARAGALPGVVVDGVAMGGQDRADVTRRVEMLARRKAAGMVIAARGDKQVSGRAGDLGYEMDVQATVDAIFYRGRQGNPVTALRDHVRSFSAITEVPPQERVDDAALQLWATRTARQLEQRPREGGLTFQEGSVTRIEPEPGATVDEKALAERARPLLVAGGGTVEAPAEEIEPETTSEDVDRVLRLAERALSGEVTFRRSGASAALRPEQIASVFRTRVRGGDIDLRVNAAALRAALGETAIAAFEAEPQSASFDISGGSIDLNPGRKGFAFDEKKAAAQLLDVATQPGDRSVVLDGDVTEPELTTREAKDLDIVEKVSEFTTYHACCESRVTNIHRIADMVDDVVIEPGETFSLNGFVGERTREKGFVNGGAIFEGEFVEQIGGGVSQFTTTLYNAAYFGGYDIVEHKAHSYYISRYPVGREATLNYPNVDLKVANDSPHGMVISTSYTDESVTVAVYGKKWVEVDSETGSRRNITQPETIYKENDELREGTSRVIQEAGASGFDITVTRILRFPDGEVRREPVTTTYLAQPRIIERNT